MEHNISRLISYTSIVSISEPTAPLSSKRDQAPSATNYRVREFINRACWERTLGALEGSD